MPAARVPVAADVRPGAAAELGGERSLAEPHSQQCSQSEPTAPEGGPQPAASDRGATRELGAAVSLIHVRSLTFVVLASWAIWTLLPSQWPQVAAPLGTDDGLGWHDLRLASSWGLDSVGRGLGAAGALAALALGVVALLYERAAAPGARAAAAVLAVCATSWWIAVAIASQPGAAVQRAIEVQSGPAADGDPPSSSVDPVTGLRQHGPAVTCLATTPSEELSALLCRVDRDPPQGWAAGEALEFHDRVWTLRAWRADHLAFPAALTWRQGSPTSWRATLKNDGRVRLQEPAMELAVTAAAPGRLVLIAEPEAAPAWLWAAPGSFQRGQAGDSLHGVSTAIAIDGAASAGAAGAASVLAPVLWLCALVVRRARRLVPAMRSQGGARP